MDFDLERENGPIRVLIPFLSFFSKVFFWFAFLVKCKWNVYDANDMFKHLIISLQKWDVTQLGPRHLVFSLFVFALNGRKHLFWLLLGGSCGCGSNPGWAAQVNRNFLMPSSFVLSP